jgi:hypothetical protein
MKFLEQNFDSKFQLGYMQSKRGKLQFSQPERLFKVIYGQEIEQNTKNCEIWVPLLPLV